MWDGQTWDDAANTAGGFVALSPFFAFIFIPDFPLPSIKSSESITHICKQFVLNFLHTRDLLKTSHLAQTEHTSEICHRWKHRKTYSCYLYKCPIHSHPAPLVFVFARKPEPSGNQTRKISALHALALTSWRSYLCCEGLRVQLPCFEEPVSEYI